MRILSFNNATELASTTEVVMKDFAEKLASPLRGFFPTGKSAEPFYSKLRAIPYWRGRFQGLQIDEFAQPDHLFLTNLQNQLIRPLALEDQFETIDPTWTDAEMQSHIQNVLSHKIDFAILGLGPNGHIGFHEPGTGDENFLGGRIELSEQSFKRVSGAKTRTALTFGAGSFLRAQKIILIAVGDEKESIFRKFVSTNSTSDLPATLLKSHPDFTVLTLFKI